MTQMSVIKKNWLNGEGVHQIICKFTFFFLRSCTGRSSLIILASKILSCSKWHLGSHHSKKRKPAENDIQRAYTPPNSSERVRRELGKEKSFLKWSCGEQSVLRNRMESKSGNILFSQCPGTWQHLPCRISKLLRSMEEKGMTEDEMAGWHH